VKATFKVAETERHGLDTLLFVQVLAAFLFNGARVDALEPLLLGREIQLLQAVVGYLEKVPQRDGFHGSCSYRCSLTGR